MRWLFFLQTIINSFLSVPCHQFIFKKGSTVYLKYLIKLDIKCNFTFLLTQQRSWCNNIVVYTGKSRINMTMSIYFTDLFTNLFETQALHFIYPLSNVWTAEVKKINSENKLWSLASPGLPMENVTTNRHVLSNTAVTVLKKEVKKKKKKTCCWTQSWQTRIFG